MDATRIRPAEAGDAGALALLGQATFLETYFDALPRADMLAHTAAEHGAARYAAFLAEADCRVWVAERPATGNLVGYLVLCPPDLPVPTSPEDLEVRRIYVLSPFRGAGLGARLMATAVDAARARGARRLLLGVYGENGPAMTFYARQGYVQAGTRRFRAGTNDYDDLVLSLTL